MTGIREPRDECTLEDVYFAVDGGWPVVYGVKVPVKLELVVVILRLPLWARSYWLPRYVSVPVCRRGMSMPLTLSVRGGFGG